MQVGCGCGALQGGVSISWRRAGFSVRSQDQGVCPQMGCMEFFPCPCVILALLRVSRSQHLHNGASFGVFSSFFLSVPPPGLLVIQTSAKGMLLMMGKPCSWAVTVREQRHRPCGCWRNGGAGMHLCGRPSSRARTLPVCSLKSAKGQAFHLTTLCLMICSTGSRGPYVRGRR